jgi:hypothetical protein
MDNDIKLRIKQALLTIDKFPFDNDHIILKKSSDKEEKEVLIFEFHSRSETEFDIYAEFYCKTYNLHCDGWHEIGLEYEDFDDPVTKIKEQLMTLTNGKTILKTTFSGQSSIKWELIHNYDEGKYESLGTVGLILFNYFGKRHELVRVNKLWE